MDIVFSGICCFVDKEPCGSGKTIIVRNALGGGMHGGFPIPPHYAFVHAKRQHVDTTNWGSGWLASEDNVLLWLTGDYVTFDPMPRGGSIDVSVLPHVTMAKDTDVICPAADEIRPGFCHHPSAYNVLALIDLPQDVPISSTTNERGAAYAKMHLNEAPLTITARPFEDGAGQERSITITDPDAQIFISNVDINSYLLGTGASDDTHRYLVCEVFKPRAMDGAVQQDEEPGTGPIAVLADVEPEGAASESALDQVSLGALRRAAGRDMSDFLSSFAAGCSPTQWP